MIIVKHFPLAIHQIEGHRIVRHAEQCESGARVAEFGSLDRADRTGQRAGGVHQVIDLAAGRLDMLEIMDMTTEVEVKLWI